jgi:hypothetical protein
VILVNTTPLVALCDARDSKHRTALRHLESLASEEFALCDAVLTEASFHLPYRSQRQRLRAMLHTLRMQPLPVTHERAFWPSSPRDRGLRRRHHALGQPVGTAIGASSHDRTLVCFAARW